MLANPSGIAPILVIDDSQPLLEMLRYALEGAGFPVIVAADGQSALDLLGRDFTPSLIITDVYMPDFSGDVIAATIEHMYHGAVPVVLMSAHADRQERAARLHAVAFLQKPFHLEQLLAVVHAHVHGPGSPRSSPEA